MSPRRVRPARRGGALLLALVVLLLLEVLVAGLFWTLRVEARAGLESLAGARAAAATTGALASAQNWIERANPDSLAAVLSQLPPPIRLPGRAVGYAELWSPDTSLVEVVAQGFAGGEGIAARRQSCALFRLRRESDSTGAPRIRLVPVPERSVASC